MRFGGVTAVEAVDLVLPQGGRLALLGESGSGKTVTALAAAGLLPPEASIAGRIEWPALGAAPRLGREVGVVFQDPMSSLNPVLTVGEQIGEVLVVHRGLGWRAARAEAALLLDRVGLPEPEAQVGAYPHELSGGQRQRVAIAMAIAAGPRLLIADEPTTALDTVVQAGIVRLLDRLVRDTGMALLVITHDLALAAQLAREAVVLYAGRRVEAGPIERLLAAPRHPYTRGLLAASRGLEQRRGGPIPEIPGGLPDPGEDLAGCPFAPRCPLVMPVCRTVMPPFLGGVACHAAGPGG